MEYRKLISFGKSSFVVSLPKYWIEKQKLKKGDILYFSDNGSNLTLSPKADKDNIKNKEIVIPIDKKELKQIQREIIGAYIGNYKTIILTGNKISDFAKEIQETIQSMVALEVMEQTSKRIVAKDFLNLDDVSTHTVIRKMDIIIRSMLEDCVKTFEDNNYESINYRDNDVNKLTFLIFRIVKFGYEYPSYMSKKFSLSANDLSNLWLLASTFESIADEVKRVARYMSRIKLDQKSKIVYEKLISEISDSYLKIVKSYYSKDVKTTHETINLREEFIKRSDNFYNQYKEVKGIAFLISSTKALIVHISHMGRIIYQG